MTNYKKFFVDTAPFIYFIEGNYNNPQYHKKIKCFLIQTWKQQAIVINTIYRTKMYYSSRIALISKHFKLLQDLVSSHITW